MKTLIYYEDLLKALHFLLNNKLEASGKIDAIEYVMQQ
jgi:hypothetical protein